MTLVDDARQFWRWWSVRLALVAGVIATTIVNQPQILTGLVAYVPPQYRTVASALVGIVVALAPTLARLIKQKAPANG